MSRILKTLLCALFMCYIVPLSGVWAQGEVIETPKIGPPGIIKTMANIFDTTTHSVLTRTEADTNPAYNIKVTFESDVAPGSNPAGSTIAAPAGTEASTLFHNYSVIIFCRTTALSNVTLSFHTYSGGKAVLYYRLDGGAEQTVTITKSGDVNTANVFTIPGTVGEHDIEINRVLNEYGGATIGPDYAVIGFKTNNLTTGSITHHSLLKFTSFKDLIAAGTTIRHRPGDKLGTPAERNAVFNSNMTFACYKITGNPSKIYIVSGRNSQNFVAQMVKVSSAGVSTIYSEAVNASYLRLKDMNPTGQSLGQGDYYLSIGRDFIDDRELGHDIDGGIVVGSTDEALTIPPKAEGRTFHPVGKIESDSVLGTASDKAGIDQYTNGQIILSIAKWKHAVVGVVKYGQCLTSHSETSSKNLESEMDNTTVRNSIQTDGIVWEMWLKGYNDGGNTVGGVFAGRYSDGGRGIKSAPPSSFSGTYDGPQIQADLTALWKWKKLNAPSTLEHIYSFSGYSTKEHLAASPVWKSQFLAARDAVNATYPDFVRIAEITPARDLELRTNMDAAVHLTAEGQRKLSDYVYALVVVPAAAAPTFAPVAGTVTQGQIVSFSSATSGATFYYTVDGTTPTTASTSGSSVTLNTLGTITVKVFATKSGLTDSAIASATYTVTAPSGGGGGGTVLTEAESYTLAHIFPNGNTAIGKYAIIWAVGEEKKLIPELSLGEMSIARIQAFSFMGTLVVIPAHGRPLLMTNNVVGNVLFMDIVGIAKQDGFGNVGTATEIILYQK
jgi:hypothetical protein